MNEVLKAIKERRSIRKYKRHMAILKENNLMNFQLILKNKI